MRELITIDRISEETKKINDSALEVELREVCVCVCACVCVCLTCVCMSICGCV
jgi:hypothetical protein